MLFDNGGTFNTVVSCTSLLFWLFDYGCSSISCNLVSLDDDRIDIIDINCGSLIDCNDGVFDEWLDALLLSLFLLLLLNNGDAFEKASNTNGNNEGLSQSKFVLGLLALPQFCFRVCCTVNE